MSDRRKILDDLRNVLQEGADDIERAGARHLDRLAERGVRELEQLRKGMAAAGDRPRDSSVSARQREAERQKRTARRAIAERKADRASRRAGRMAKKARRHAEKMGRRHRGGAPAEAPEIDAAEREMRRTMRSARRRANQRICFVTHFGSYLATLAIILVTTRSFRVVTLVALGWGIGVFCHYLWAMAAPKMRDRWVEEEVGARSARSVQTERRQVETRSRRSLEDLSASIAHEIRNPITAAKSLVQQMGEDPASDENLEYAGLALSELDRVERSISHLLRYARDEEPRFSPLSLFDVAGAAVEGMRDRAGAVGIELQFEFDGEGEMRGDAEKLRRVIENLISNAIDALTEAQSPLPQIHVLAGENLAGNEIWLRVIDNGPGIPADERERVWSPFYTTKDAGTGLGLALSRKTIEAHGGRIDLLSDLREGSEFILSFPKDPNGVLGSVGGSDVE
jgi:signal transduction histidine kinase